MPPQIFLNFLRTYQDGRLISMPAKSRSNKGHARPDFSEKKKDETIAFVICHPMECSLTPITEEFPPCLFPVCNAPVLLYTLNWLNVNGIEQIYILCRQGDEARFASILQQCRDRMLMNSITILETDAKIYNVGDAMRWINAWNTNTNAFTEACVVVQGNTITNIPLKDIVDRHRKRIQGAKGKSKSPVPVITTVFTRSMGQGYSVLVDDTDMILHVHEPPILPIVQGDPLTINPDILRSAQKLKIKSALNDAKVYICTSQVLVSFNEQYWRDVVTDCIPSLIKHMELCNHASYGEFVQDCYSVVTDDLPDYLAASVAIARRWMYPLTVDANFFAPFAAYPLAFDEEADVADEAPKTCQECTAYRLGRYLVYLYDDVFPSLSAKLEHTVVVGAGTELQDDCVIRNTTIGSQCSIGRGAVLDNCVIWDGVTIEEGARLSHCVVASGATISANTTVSFGCILSFGVTSYLDLPPCTRLTQFCGGDEEELAHNVPEWLSEYVNNKAGVDIPEDVGTYEFVPYPEQELPLLKMWYELSPENFPIDASTLTAKTDGDDGEDDNAQWNSGLDEEEQDSSEFVRLDDDFQAEAVELLTGLLEKDEIDIEQFRSEFVAFRNSKNASEIDCTVALILQIIRHWGPGNVEEGIKQLRDLLRSFMAPGDVQLESNSLEVQQDFLFWWQSYCAKDIPRRKALFVEVLKSLSSEGLLNSKAVRSWSEEQEDCNEREKELFEFYSE